eukprot:CAMPEP_0178419780 /NCGR_PEP_ID=MMETSP0689_2-20121128/25788_1 /TAXON_ID=160604 /ORGANISM="Amphidinium massartii, Strain CS-259" /LENGTH=324 /DNA_ID=CAMNT_0020041231 /DNA_START=143 /DNA_END=1114 /DNA_ORIENTATION=+
MASTTQIFPEQVAEIPVIDAHASASAVAHAVGPWAALHLKLKHHLPDTSLLLAGALGGPFVIASLTPLRNAMSIGAKDANASASALYGRVFGYSASTPNLGMASRIRMAYTGAHVSAMPACPQFVAIGPTFHLFDAVFPRPVALFGASFIETLITYGSQSRNAQLAFNAQCEKARGGLIVPLSSAWRPWGPGAAFFQARNFVGMSGIRLLSPPLQSALEPMIPNLGTRQLASDMLASAATCVVSMPLNLAWTYVVTTPELEHAPAWKRGAAAMDFMRRQFITECGSGLSKVALRDFSLRCAYVASVFTMFRSIERMAVKLYGSS